MKTIVTAKVIADGENYRQGIHTGGFRLAADEPVSGGGQGAYIQTPGHVAPWWLGIEVLVVLLPLTVWIRNHACISQS